MREPAFGDKIYVRPAAGVKVQWDADIHGRFMQNEFELRTWNDWLHRRLRDGSIEICLELPGQEATEE